MTAKQRLKKDIKVVLWIALALFTGLALFSYSPFDNSFNSIGSRQFKNFCGWPGSIMADLFFQFWGVSSWAFVVLMLRAAYLSYLEEESTVWSWLTATLILFNISGLIALHAPGWSLYNGNVQSAGIVGTYLSKGMVNIFNFAGTAIILWTLGIIFLFMYTNFTMQAVVEALTKRQNKRSLGGISKLWSKVTEKTQELQLIPSPLLEPVPTSGVAHKPQPFQFKSKIAAIFKSLSFGSGPALPTEQAGPKNGLPGSEKNNPPGLARQGLRKEAKEILAGSSQQDSADTGVHEFEHDEDDSAEVEELDSEFECEEESAAEVNLASRFTEPSGRRKVRLKTKVQRKIENWKLPDLNLLEDPPATRYKVDEKEMKIKAILLTDKLSQFSVTGEVTAIKPGPAVTMFEFKPRSDVKISKITELADDLSLALSAESVRIIAPIPGRDVVGIETSNQNRETVYLKDILADDQFWKEDIRLPVALGRQADGTPKVVDLRKMPHLLVAGTTGSGKSVFVVSLLMGLLFRHSPKTLRLIIVDPKQVDLSVFGKVPHLLMPLITEAKKAVVALKWAIKEMEKRYKSMSKFGARGLESYNEIVEKLSKEEIDKHEAYNQELADAGKLNEQYYWSPQPYIVIVVEEFADLMAVDKVNVEQSVVRLAQMARACGMHLTLAMQSPRKDVVTGLIKTNIPGRISFKVASKMDSRIILDDSGAERLLAKGDMLFLAPGVAKPERHHGPWLTDSEIGEVAQFWADQGEPVFEETAMQIVNKETLGGDTEGSDFGDDEPDARYDEILAWASTMKEVSASLIQRKFRLGYPRAARMIELFEREGVVGPANGSKPRQVLVNSLKEL